jgi:TP901 family phage tail tape measure protein
MAMNLEAVLRIAAKVVGLEDITKLERGIAGAEKVAKDAKTSFSAVVNSATWQAAAVGAAGIGVALGTSVRAAIDFESAMADVRKVVPGLESAEGLKEMKQEIIGLSKELPVSAEGLAAIMAAAGQSGIPRQELAEFTKQAAQMGVAFDITADEAGTAMAKLRTSLGLTQPEVVNLADAMNFLSNNMASSAAEVNQFMLMAGSVGQQVAMTTEQTAALGSAMVAAGAAPEVAATSFRNLIRALTKGESATERQAAAFKRLGLDATQAAKDMQTDAIGTIRDVFQRISQMPAEMRVSTISEIFGDEARALTPLITNMALFDQAIGLVGDKSKYAGSMLAEFEARAGTSANNFQLLQNNLAALQIAIGEGLLPAINMMLASLTPVLSVIADLAGRFPLLTAVVVTLTAALAGLVILAPAIVSFITLLGSLKAVLAVSSLAVGWAGLQTVVIVAVAAMKGALLGFIGWVGSVFIPGLLAFMGPVGWTVLAIAAVVAMAIAFREPLLKFVAWLWEWGEPIRKFWIGLWDGLVAFVGFSLGTISKVLSTYAGVLLNLWSGMFSALQKVVDMWRGAVQAVWSVVGRAFTTFVVEPIRNAWTGLTTWLRNAINSVVQIAQGAWTVMAESLRNVFRGVLQFIANQINAVAGLINRLIAGYNSLPNFGDLPFIPMVAVPAFAEGGVVNRPTVGLVGEAGREYIIPESKMAAASSRFLAGQRGASVIPAGSSSPASMARTPQVNITTGPVMQQQDGSRWVSIDDLERATQQTAEQVLAMLRTPQARIALGR